MPLPDGIGSGFLTRCCKLYHIPHRLIAHLTIEKGYKKWDKAHGIWGGVRLIGRPSKGFFHSNNGLLKGILIMKRLFCILLLLCLLPVSGLAHQKGFGVYAEAFLMS
jgi:hypothetical protein